MGSLSKTNSSGLTLRHPDSILRLFFCTIFMVSFLLSSPGTKKVLSQAEAGEIIVFIRDGNVWSIHPDGSNERQLTIGGGYHDPALSPDGSSLAVIYQFYSAVGKPAYEVRLLNLELIQEDLLVPSEKTPFVLLGNYYSFRNPDWSADGRFVFFMAEDGRAQGDSIRKVEVSSGNQDKDLVVTSAQEFAASPVGNMLVYKTWSNTELSGNGLVTIDDAGNKIREILPLLGNQFIYGFCWDNSGSSIIYLAYSISGQTSLNWISADGSEIGVISDSLDRQDILADCSPSDQRLILQKEASLYLFDTATGEENFLTFGEQPSWGIKKGVSSRITETPTLTPTVTLTPTLTPTRILQCGSWKWDGPYTSNDLRIKTTNITDVIWLPDCRGGFLLQNNTGYLNLGEYTLELNVQTDSAHFIWQPPHDPAKNVILHPLTSYEIYIYPSNISYPATVFIQGIISTHTVAYDLAFKLIIGIMDIALGGAVDCFIPVEQIAALTVEVYEVLMSSATLAMNGDILGSIEELKQIINKFLDRTVEALKDIGYDCVAEAVLKKIVGKPFVIAKIILDFSLWLSVNLFDLIRYGSRPAMVYLNYSPVSYIVIPGIEMEEFIGTIREWASENSSLTK